MHGSLDLSSHLGTMVNTQLLQTILCIAVFILLRSARRENSRPEANCLTV